MLLFTRNVTFTFSFFISLLFSLVSYAEEELIIKFHPSVSSAQSSSFLAEHSLLLVEKIEELNMCTVKSTSATDDVSQLIEVLEADVRTQYVEINVRSGSTGFLPNDPVLSTQWHHDTINSQSAWDITRGDESVIVAVLDSGLEAGNSELSGNRFLPGFDFVDDDATVGDDNGHGTRVTGLITANADNNFSGAGVDHNATILPVKVLDAGGFGTTFNLVQGISYAVSQGADIINMSLINYPNASSLTEAMQAARSSGVILLACAGNGGIGNADTSYPGASPLTISIGATTAANNRASFSGTGSALDIVAPGSSTYTTSYQSSSNFDLFSGCSAATPIVAGVAALAKAVKPTLGHDEFHDILMLSSHDEVATDDVPGRDDLYGWGLLDALAALEAIDTSGTFVPARIEAEDFSDSFDTSPGNNGDAICNVGDTDAQLTSDNDGFCNIGWTVAGEWLDYEIYVDEAGAYELRLRLASRPGGEISVELDNNIIGSASVLATNWQNFSDYFISAQLSQGTHTIRVNFIDGNVNFNFMEIKQEQGLVFNSKKDTYIRGGNFADDSFGVQSNLIVKGNNSPNYTREAYLQFDIADLTSTSVQKAVVRLYANRVDQAQDISLHRIVSNNAQENAITWNNSPDEGSAIDTTFVSAEDSYYEWDVTSYLNEKLGYNTFNVMLKDPNVINSFVYFNSREASSNLPELVVTSN